MKSPFFYFLRTLNKLSYDHYFFWIIKDRLRSVKHFFLGKTGMDEVLETIIESHGKEHPIKVVFDIGAAVGDKTLIFLRQFEKATIYAFEPQTESADILKKRTARFQERVEFFEQGFLNKNDTATLYIKNYKDGSSLISPPENVNDKDLKVEKTALIHVLTLDDFVAANNIHHIDFIKIDVEGVEKEVLEGGKKTFFSDTVDNVFIEMNAPKFGVRASDFYLIFKFFHEAGFVFMGVYNDYFFSKDPFVLKKYSDTLKNEIG